MVLSSKGVCVIYIILLPKRQRFSFYIYPFPWCQTGQAGHSRQRPQPPKGKTKRKTERTRTREGFAPKWKNKGKTKEKVQSNGGRLSPLPLTAPPLLHWGDSLRFCAPDPCRAPKSRTASVARPSHRGLTEGVRGCFDSHDSPIFFHIFLACGAHARHLVNRGRRDCGSPLVHHHHLLVSVIPNLSRLVPIAA